MPWCCSRPAIAVSNVDDTRSTVSSGLNLPSAHGAQPMSGTIRSLPEDFVVEEELSFQPEGRGQHVFLRLRKRQLNTADLAARLARFAGVRRGDVGYAGLKDRQAVTSQWFSVDLGNREELDWSALEAEDLQVEAITRNGRKLRRGALAGNHFKIVVRALQGERQALEARVRGIAEAGVPNYFGPQRFGRDLGNLRQAARLFRGERVSRDRHRRGLYLSAARAWLFNRVLAARVTNNSWNRYVPGDALILDGSSSFFSCSEQPVDEDISQRVGCLDLHPSGPLWGVGESPVVGEVQCLENEVLADEPLFRQGLEANGLRHERRALRLGVRSLRWELEDDMLHLSFWLPSGSYATAALQEFVAIRESSQRCLSST